MINILIFTCDENSASSHSLTLLILWSKSKFKLSFILPVFRPFCFVTLLLYWCWFLAVIWGYGKEMLPQNSHDVCCYSCHFLLAKIILEINNPQIGRVLHDFCLCVYIKTSWKSWLSASQKGNAKSQSELLIARKIAVEICFIKF